MFLGQAGECAWPDSRVALVCCLVEWLAPYCATTLLRTANIQPRRYWYFLHSSAERQPGRAVGSVCTQLHFNSHPSVLRMEPVHWYYLILLWNSSVRKCLLEQRFIWLVVTYQCFTFRRASVFTNCPVDTYELWFSPLFKPRWLRLVPLTASEKDYATVDYHSVNITRTPTLPRKY